MDCLWFLDRAFRRLDIRGEGGGRGRLCGFNVNCGIRFKFLVFHGCPAIGGGRCAWRLCVVVVFLVLILCKDRRRRGEMGDLGYRSAMVSLKWEG